MPTPSFAPILRRLEAALKVERQTLKGFLTNMAEDFEANHRDIGYQAVLVDSRRADADMQASKSPKDYYRRLGRWVGPAWWPWIEERALGAAHGERGSSA